MSLRTHPDSTALKRASERVIISRRQAHIQLDVDALRRQRQDLKQRPWTPAVDRALVASSKRMDTLGDEYRRLDARNRELQGLAT